MSPLMHIDRCVRAGRLVSPGRLMGRKAAEDVLLLILAALDRDGRA